MGHLVDGDGAGHDLVADRIVQLGPDEVVDGAVEGGREEQRLVGAGDVAQQPLDLGQEPHVDHAVGLVEHHDLDVAEGDHAPVDEVDQATRRGDDHVDAVAQGSDLVVHAGAAVHRRHPPVDRLGQGFEDLGDLEGELPGRNQDQGSGPLRRRPRDAGENREAEGERLARPGLGFAAHVTAGDAVGDGQSLDGKGKRDTGVVERSHQGGRQAEIREGLGEGFG